MMSVELYYTTREDVYITCMVAHVTGMQDSAIHDPLSYVSYRLAHCAAVSAWRVQYPRFLVWNQYARQRAPWQIGRHDYSIDVTDAKARRDPA
jgi:hypothetical protein